MSSTKSSATATNDKALSSSPSLSILTVGDGDLSGSLALQRAYPEATIVASTLLPSYHDLIQTYPETAAPCVKALRERENPIVYGVDATRLHLHPTLLEWHCGDNENTNNKTIGPFDLIIFQYPHLGYDQDNDTHSDNDDETTTTHEQRHSLLLAQYLASARRLFLLRRKNSNADNEPCRQKWPLLPCIHVCLTQSSVVHWNVMDTARQLQLELVNGAPLPASRPMLSTILVAQVDDAMTMQQQQDNRHSENNNNKTQNNHKASFHLSSSGGSRKGHWLGKYGYRHQPTHPDATRFQTNVGKSFHFFWRLS